MVSVVLVGCGGGPQTMQSTDTGDMPAWYPNPPQDPLYLRSANTAVSQDLQVAIDKATTGARAELGRMLETKVNSLQKRLRRKPAPGRTHNSCNSSRRPPNLWFQPR